MNKFVDSIAGILIFVVQFVALRIVFGVDYVCTPVFVCVCVCFVSSSDRYDGQYDRMDGVGRL